MVSRYNMLVLAPFYREFVKGIVDATASHVSDISVIVHHNRLAEISRYVPLGGYFSHVRGFTANRLIDESNKPGNVKVSLLSMTYLIPDGKNSSLGDALFRKADQLIQARGLKFDIVQGPLHLAMRIRGRQISREVRGSYRSNYSRERRLVASDGQFSELQVPVDLEERKCLGACEQARHACSDGVLQRGDSRTWRL